MKAMISVLEAKDLIRAHVQALGAEQVLLIDGLGCCLAEDVFSPIDMPGFNQSAMDGYALNWAGYQSASSLLINGAVVPAGDTDAGPKPAPNEAVRIFTGAVVPLECDTVVMQEKVRVENNVLYIDDVNLTSGKNVRLKGSEICNGELALAKGTILTPGGIGFLASLGIVYVAVVRAPRITIIVTGDELQSPGEPLATGQVYESNSQLLQAALTELRFSQSKIVYAKDDFSGLTAALGWALTDSDLVILTGGVSVGDYDYVPRAAGACGVEAVFHKVKQKPGKPIFFGHYTGSKSVVFGLPGNPASVLSCFYQYVVIALGLLTERSLSRPQRMATMAQQYQKPPGLTHFLKGRLTGDVVELLGAQESYRLSSFSMANVLIEIPESVDFLFEGDEVLVHLL